MEAEKSAVRERHWTKSRNLTIGVLVVWFIFGYIIPWNAKGLNELSFLGFPLGYYFCVQGSLIVFVVLIFFQNWFQDKIDAEAGITEFGSSDEASAPAQPEASAPEPAPQPQEPQEPQASEPAQQETSPPEPAAAASAPEQQASDSGQPEAAQNQEK